LFWGGETESVRLRFWREDGLSACSHTGLSDHGDADGELEEHTDAAAVEAVEDALGDEDALHGVGDVGGRLANQLRAICLCNLVGLLSAFLTCAGVAEDAGHNEGGEVGHLGAADTAGTADSERPHDGGEGDADSEDGEKGVDDGVEGEHDGPLGVAVLSDSLTQTRSAHFVGTATAVIEGAGVAIGHGGWVVFLIDGGGVRKETPVETHEGGRDDEGARGARAQHTEKGAFRHRLGRFHTSLHS